MVARHFSVVSLHFPVVPPQAIRREVKRLRARCAEMDAEAGCSDHRMTSMGVYLLRNRAAVTPDLRWMLLQHYTHPAVGAVTS